MIIPYPINDHACFQVIFPMFEMLKDVMV
jgi:hypothetical protein